MLSILPLLARFCKQALPDAGNRWLSASAAGGSTQQQHGLTLKAALRQLYKRVHPDLFHDFPAEQAENERSFKLLQDYLQQAREPSSGPASRTAYFFRFYLQPPAGVLQDDTRVAAGSGSSADPAFQLVALQLVPPQASRPGSGQLSPGVRKGLGKLLQLCGLPLAEEDLGDDSADAAAHLAQFLPEAAEVVRQHESGVGHHEVQAANLKAALRLAHQVMVGFPPGMFPRVQQVELLQRMAAAVDLLADECLDLSGLHVLICQRTGLDSQGNLLLSAGDSSDEWADFLGGVDLDYARGKREACSNLRKLEAGVASAVGVRMLFTAAPYLMTHEYRAFLERLAAHAAEHGPVRMSATTPSSGSSSSSASNGKQPQQQQQHHVKPYLNIPVYVAPPYHDQQHDQKQQGPEQQAVHEEMGYINVAMSASAAAVYNTIKTHGHAAAAILSRKQQQQQELSEMITLVRSRLGLRRLLKDELISVREFMSCCKRLMHHRDLLLHCNIEGLSIRVSDKNRVAADGSVVDIDWNFQV